MALPWYDENAGVVALGGIIALSVAAVFKDWIKSTLENALFGNSRKIAHMQGQLANERKANMEMSLRIDRLCQVVEDHGKQLQEGDKTMATLAERMENQHREVMGALGMVADNLGQLVTRLDNHISSHRP